jgi:glycine/D-amino acid oxidase-like deaminating enzyme
MNAYDWIVVGNGFAGAALSYELQRLGHSVLVLEQEAIAQNATRYSYGGIPYWSAKTPVLQQLFHEGIERQRQLSAELGTSTEFRELDLLLVVSPHDDPDVIATQYTDMSVPPTPIDVQTALEMEPLLNREAIAGAFTVRHGHVNPQAMLNAYNQAFLRLGGTLRTERVVAFTQVGDRITGVQTSTETYPAAQIVVCAGGLSRSLFKGIGLSIPCYYTQAELIEIPAVEFQFQTLLMPAQVKRFAIEAAAGDPQLAGHWDRPGQELLPPILDPGIFQFQDRHLCVGQISRTLSDRHPTVDAVESERLIREAVCHYVPVLQDVPGQWHQCLVAFSADQKPLIGAMPGREGVTIFSGFSSPFALLPPLAQRFAIAQTTSSMDEVLHEFSVARFSQMPLS